MTIDDKCKFDELVKTKGCTSEQMISDLLTKYEQDSFKLDHPEHSQVINRFESYESAIRRIFEGLIFDFEEQRETIKMEFSEELTAKDKLIADLICEKQELNNVVNSKVEDLAGASKSLDELKRNCEVLEKSNQNSLNELKLLKENISVQDSFRDLYVEEKDKVSKLNESIFEKENKINDLMEKINELKIEN